MSACLFSKIQCPRILRKLPLTVYVAVALLVSPAQWHPNGFCGRQKNMSKTRINRLSELPIHRTSCLRRMSVKLSQVKVQRMRTVMKLNGSETTNSALSSLQIRIWVFSMVNPNTKRRRGSSFIAWFMPQQILLTSWYVETISHWRSATG